MPWRKGKGTMAREQCAVRGDVQQAACTGDKALAVIEGCFCLLILLLLLLPLFTG
jgi:hypothetical protein